MHLRERFVDTSMASCDDPSNIRNLSGCDSYPPFIEKWFVWIIFREEIYLTIIIFHLSRVTLHTSSAVFSKLDIPKYTTFGL